jgi:enoyl-CoA hydratase
MYNDFKTLKCEQRGAVMIVTINRPEVLNALCPEMHDDFMDCFGKMRKDRSVKAVVLTGAGDKAFVAGADIAFMSTQTVVQAREFGYLGLKAQGDIASFPKPVIAAINGFAFGGGCEIAMCCDIRLASDKAQFGQLEITLGIIPGGGGTQRLPRLVGAGIAKEMIFTGMRIDAQRAFEIGLVNRVVPHDTLIDEAVAMAEKIAQKSGVILGLCKSAIDTGLNMDLESGLSHEVEMFAACFATKDAKEGLTAFVEKRKPVFKDE